MKKKNAKPHENHKCQQFWNTTTNILSKEKGNACTDDWIEGWE